jgi:hypothetical protein
LKLRELVTVCVFLIGLVQIPPILAELLRVGLWVADFRQADDLFTKDHFFFITQVASVAASLAKVALTLSLVFLPNWWAGLVPRAIATLEVPSLSLHSVQVSLVALAGLVLIVLALSDLTEYLVSWHTRRPFDNSAIDLTMSQVTYRPLIAKDIVRLALGAWMLFGAQGLIEVWHRVRGDEHISSNAT